MASFTPSVRSDTTSLEHALIHEPGDELTDVIDPDAWGWNGLPRLKKAVKEHQAFVDALTDHEVEIHRLGETEAELAEAMFVHDVGFALEGGVIVGNMHEEIRSGEEQGVTNWIVEKGWPVYHTVHGPGRFEAGNMIWLDEETVAVGRSMTTNAEGIRQIRSVLDTYGIELLEVPIFGSTESSGQTHLGLVFGMVTAELALIYPQAVPSEFLDLLRDCNIEPLTVPRREQRKMATSIVVTEPGHVILPGGNRETKRKLREEGIDVTEIDIREIRKARGGLRGLLLPLVRGQY